MNNIVVPKCKTLNELLDEYINLYGKDIWDLSTYDGNISLINNYIRPIIGESIIESFGTGIGEAKRSLEDNGSPELYYKVFDSMDTVTSVVIPVNEEYLEIKSDTNSKKKLGIESETQEIKQKIGNSAYSKSVKRKMVQIYEQIGSEVFGNSRVVEILECSDTTATTYIKKMHDELHIINEIEGSGKGKYKFIQE